MNGLPDVFSYKYKNIESIDVKFMIQLASREAIGDGSGE